MKNIYTTIALVLVTGIVCSQTKATKKADQLFESHQYVNAIEAYLQVANSTAADQHVYQNLADSYYQIFNTAQAAKWYEKVTQKTTNAETYYRYAQSLKSLGKYEEANTQLAMFAKLVPTDARAQAYISNPNYLTNLNTAKKLFNVEKTLLAVDKSTEFGPVLTNDNDLYFVSTRKQSKIDKWSNQPYLDVYKATRNADGTFSEITEVKELNSPYHDGPVTISNDGNTMFFSRDGLSANLFEKDKKNNVKIGHLGIYKAVKKEGKWTGTEALPINSTKYSVSNPSLSEDGKTLYFSSNMPGGFGENDIWKVAISENGYGKPENLGTKINTAGRETFPFVTSDGVLYFASNGLPGFGGLDIFKADLAHLDTAVNVGKPVNTEMDDFSLSINTKMNVGYFASNRSGFDHIYQATLVCSTNFLAVLTDSKSGKNIENATVTLLNDKNVTLSAQTSDSAGTTLFSVDCNAPYTMQITAANYKSLTYTIEKTNQNQVTIPLVLVPNEVIITDTEVLLGNIYFEFNQSNITTSGAVELNKLVTVLNENPTMVLFIKSHTDSKGNDKYNRNLSEQRAQSTVQYLISKGITKERVSGKGFGSTEPKVLCGADCTDEQNAINRRSEFIIVKK